MEARKQRTAPQPNHDLARIRRDLEDPVYVRTAIEVLAGLLSEHIIEETYGPDIFQTVDAHHPRPMI